MRGQVILNVLNIASARRSENARLLGRIFGNNDLRDAVAYAVDRQFGHNDVGDVQSFFQWILDHQEEIIAFIKMLMELFNPPALMTASGDMPRTYEELIALIDERIRYQEGN